MAKSGERMNTPVITLPGEDYQRVKDGKITRIICPASQRLNLKVYDWIHILFKDTNDNVMVEIESIDFTLFKNLNLDIALKCGFNSVNDLKRDLVEKSPTLDNASRLYIYSFFVVGVSEKVGEE